MGSNCTECRMGTSGTGLCKSCDSCSGKYSTITCAFYNKNQFIDVFYTGCINCSGNTCSTCYDRSNNGNYGTNCTNCAIIDSVGKTGYCKNCRLCGPLNGTATCKNRVLGISLNETSCTNCTVKNNDTVCQSCQGVYNSTQKGINCTSCFMSQNNKAYCSSCDFCAPYEAALSLCGNTKLSIYYYLTLNETSCQNCSRVGT